MPSKKKIAPRRFHRFVHSSTSTLMLSLIGASVIATYWGVDAPLGAQLLQSDNSICALATVPEVLRVGSPFQANFDLINNSQNTWTPSLYTLHLQQDSGPWSGVDTINISAHAVGNESDQVLPGEGIRFGRIFIAPANPGTYDFDWRMLNASGGVFGDTCHTVIVVKSEQVPVNDNFGACTKVTSVPQDIVNAGQSVTLNMTFQNEGTKTWRKADGYRVVPDPSRFWHQYLTKLPGFTGGDLPYDVAPGKQVTVSVTLPAVRIGKFEAVGEIVKGKSVIATPCGVNISVQAVAVNKTQKGNNARCLAVGVPTTVNAGQTFSGRFTMLNNGDTTWTAKGTIKDTTSYKLGISNPKDSNMWGPARVILPGSTSPNAKATFNGTFTAPQQPGTYSFDWRMVKESTEWFGETCGPMTIKVVAPANSSSSQAVSSSSVAASSASGGPDNAVFISVDGPDALKVGDAATYHITWRNTGGVTWDRTTGHALVPDPQWADHALVPDFRILPPGPIMPNQTVTFDIAVTATKAGPFALGGYLVQNGTRVGTNNFAKLIYVSQAATNTTGTDGASFVAVRGPDTLTQNQTATYEVEYRNTGNSTWKSGDAYGLKSNPAYAASNIFTATILVDHDVAPGESYVFHIPYTAKSVGQFTIEGLMSTKGTAFGPSQPYGKTIVVGGAATQITNAAVCISMDLPASVHRNAPLDVTLTFKNVGTSTWTQGNYFLIPSPTYLSQQYFTLEDATDLPVANVAPGESATFVVHTQAVTKPASHRPFALILSKGKNNPFSATCGTRVDVVF